MTRLLAAAAWIAALLIVSAAPAPARPEPRHVLLLYSYEREFTHYTFAGLFRPELSRSSSDPIDFIEVSLQPARASRTDPDASTLDAIRSVVAGRKLELVVPIGGPAATFVQKHGQQLFETTPVLLAAVDSRFIESRALGANETAVTVRHDPPRMIETILRLMPETKTVVVVIGASRLEQFWLQEVKRTFAQFDGRVTFLWTNEWPLAEILKRSSALPPHSAIFYGILALDASGTPQIETQTLDALHASANAPLFGLHSSQLGHGIVGGPLISIDELSRLTAAVALRLLRGEAPHTIETRTLQPGVPTFDARELRRWNIAESRLDAASVVRFREPTTWQTYRGAIVATVSVVAAQTVLLIALVVKRGRPRTPLLAPSDVGDAEAALARLTHRLMQAQEHERASIAKAIHDDVCQQLTGLTLRLHGLSREPGGATLDMRTRLEELCAQFWSLEREIVALSDPLYHRLSLLGLAAASRAFCERRCADKGLGLDFNAIDISETLPPDVALAVFRVLEESLSNALAHAAARRVEVTLSTAGGVIQLDVADDGRGFDVDAEMRKGALGLIGIRERLRLVDGVHTIESRPGAGTLVRARVPVASAAAAGTDQRMALRMARRSSAR